MEPERKQIPMASTSSNASPGKRGYKHDKKVTGVDARGAEHHIDGKQLQIPESLENSYDAEYLMDGGFNPYTKTPSKKTAKTRAPT